jgi:hypothetical protein
MKAEKPVERETILDVRAEGGSLTLYKRRKNAGVDERGEPKLAIAPVSTTPRALPRPRTLKGPDPARAFQFFSVTQTRPYLDCCPRPDLDCCSHRKFWAQKRADRDATGFRASSRQSGQVSRPAFRMRTLICGRNSELSGRTLREMIV